MRPSISVIIPVYNAAKYLSRCINSIFEQNYDDTEIICVNDGSTDESLKILEEYGDKIKIINQENKGAAAARNAGIKIASKDYITFIDADDYIDNGLFQHFADSIGENDIDIFMYNGKIITQNQKQEHFFFNESMFKPGVTEQSVIDHYSIANYFYGNQSVCNKIYRRAFLSEHNILLNEGTIFEDTPFYFKTLIHAKKIKFTLKPYYNYLSDNLSSVTKTVGDNAFGLFDTFLAMENDVRELKLWDFFCYALFQLEYEKLISVMSEMKEERRAEFFAKSKEFIIERVQKLKPEIYVNLVNINFCQALINYSFEQFCDTLLLSKSDYKYQNKVYENPLFSIIVPVYNTRRFLPLCLKSLINQSYDNFEIVCVNDGSPDDSGEFLKEIAEKDSRIKIITQNNKGLGGARNTGIRNATGEYILFLDSDDWLSLDTLKKISETIKEKPTDIGIFGFNEFIDDNMRLLPTDYINQFDKFDVCKCADIKPLMYLFQCVWNKYYKRDFLINNRLFFAENVVFEDVIIHTKAMILANSITFCRGNFYYYRIRQDSIMKSQYSHKKIDDLVYAFSSTIRWLKKDGYYNEYKDVLFAFANNILAVHQQRAGQTFGKILVERVKECPELRELLGIRK